jgi:predicted nucleic-acid-binding Zn-ribbon protein
MSNCPKCGSYKIIGPKYESALTHGLHALFAHEREWLRFTCSQCNYSTTMTLAASDGHQHSGMR